MYPLVKYMGRMLGFYEHLGELKEAMHGNSESFSEAFFKNYISKCSTNE